MSDPKKRHIAFCLCPRSPMFSIASGLEVLRHANRFAGQTIYSWSLLCESDAPIQVSNHLWLHPSSDIASAKSPDIALVVAGFNPADIDAPKITRWLQKLAKTGCTIGSLSNGAFLLAKARLLDGFATTVHWEDFANFCNLYPQTVPRYQRFVIDRNRMSCSGGASTLDLFIEIVRRDLGNDLAQEITRQMLLQDYPMPRSAESDLEFDGSHQLSARVQCALNLLDVEVDQRMSVSGLADKVGLSRRELLRLFRRETGKTPLEVLNQRRLERAQSLVLYSHLPMAQISAAVGFSSQSHLTSCYKKYYNTTPALHRRSHNLKQ